MSSIIPTIQKKTSIIPPTLYIELDIQGISEIRKVDLGVSFFQNSDEYVSAILLFLRRNVTPASLETHH